MPGTSFHSHLVGALTLAAIGGALLAPPAAAQGGRPKSAAGGRAVPNPGEALERNAIARQITADQPDLVIESASLSADGNVSYAVRNRSSTIAGVPFVVDVYVDGKREDTMKHDPLPGHAELAAVSSLARFAGCETGTIRVVADAQLVVAEFDENNNEQQRQITPPCPDFSVSIKKNWEDNNTRYRAHVTITNVGNAPSPAGMIVKVIGGPSGLESVVDPNGLPLNSNVNIGALAPGQSESFNAGGKHLGTTTLYVKVFVDFHKLVRESNETNNVVDKKL